MHQNSLFQRGSAVFTCRICTRRTRETGEGVEGLCAQCYEICGQDNTVNDCGYEGAEAAPYVAEAERLLAIIAERGGDVAKVRAFNRYLWPAR